VSLFWLVPVAWAGLALAALPVLIHLLARHRSRRVLLPSLRFLPSSQLAALRRRAVADWPLLLVRIAIVAAAVAAAAAPVFVSAARQRAWSGRIARAIVLTYDSASLDAIANGEASGAFTARSFPAANSTLPDAIREARDWLRAQAPASRELVIAGDIRERSLVARDLDILEPHVGIRFLPLPAAADPPLRLEAIAETPAGGVGFFRVAVDADARQTSAAYTLEPHATLPQIRVAADPASQGHADALLRAVLREGVIAGSTVDRALTVVFDGGNAPDDRPAGTADTAGQPPSWQRAVLGQNPEVRAIRSGDALVVRAEVKATDASAADLLARIVRAAYADHLDTKEPRLVDAARLASWSRPAAGAPPDARPANEGDHRWLWAAALLLMGLEHLIRRRPRRV
jgi:hypothetical protein